MDDFDFEVQSCLLREGFVMTLTSEGFILSMSGQLHIPFSDVAVAALVNRYSPYVTLAKLYDLYHEVTCAEQKAEVWGHIQRTKMTIKGLEDDEE